MILSMERLSSGPREQTREIMPDAARNAVPTLPAAQGDEDGTWTGWPHQ